MAAIAALDFAQGLRPGLPRVGVGAGRGRSCDKRGSGLMPWVLTAKGVAEEGDRRTRPTKEEILLFSVGGGSR